MPMSSIANFLFYRNYPVIYVDCIQFKLLLWYVKRISLQNKILSLMLSSILFAYKSSKLNVAGTEWKVERQIKTPFFPTQETVALQRAQGSWAVFSHLPMEWLHGREKRWRSPFGVHVTSVNDFQGSVRAAVLINNLKRLVHRRGDIIHKWGLTHPLLQDKQ